MNEEMTETLNRIVCDVFERMAFMFGEIVEKASLPSLQRTGYLAKMGFEGPICGSVSMAVAQSMCPVIAANVLGMDEDDEFVTEKSLDALKEMLNVICGQIVTSLAGDEPVFDLSVPQVVDIGADEWKSLMDQEESLAFIVDDEPVLFHLTLESR
ncbi:MAG TPA: chemotaxis protein CheX [bacterium]|nr:chemotaxis protein CheX [bacterium]